MALSDRIPHDRQVLALTLLAGLPAVLLATWFVWTGTNSTAVRWTLTILVMGSWLGFAILARERVVHPLRTWAESWPRSAKAISRSRPEGRVKAIHWVNSPSNSTA
jgi:hypothetical protein